MSVELTRVDERLIHGQVMTAWVRCCNIQRIVLADDELAKDEFMKQILTMSAPKGVKVDVLSAAETAKRLQNPGGERIMVLLKNIDGAVRLAQAGFSWKKLNIGNIGSAAGRKPITREVYVSEAEKAQLRDLAARGVEITIQKLPQDKEIHVLDKI